MTPVPSTSTSSYVDAERGTPSALPKRAITIAAAGTTSTSSSPVRLVTGSSATRRFTNPYDAHETANSSATHGIAPYDTTSTTTAATAQAIDTRLSGVRRSPSRKTPIAI